MKPQRLNLLLLCLLVLIAALYRIVPGRPFGFEPMIAMAIFGGAVIKDKKWAFAIPMFAMLISDVLYEVLMRAGVSKMAGFYDGQWLNYLLLAGITFFGIFMKRVTVRNVALAAVAGPLLYYVLSNTGVWAGGGGYGRPLAGAGWLMAMEDGLPFLKWSLISSVAFSLVLFGGYALLQRPAVRAQRAMA